MKFILARISNSRLMGSMGLMIKWEDKGENFYQYFLLDSEGLGMADHVYLENPTPEEAHREEERLMGGLGANRIDINEDEVRFLIDYFGKVQDETEEDLPSGMAYYLDFLDSYSGNLTIDDLYPKICKKLDSEVEFVNYMMMRFIARDSEALKYFSGREEIAKMHLTKINGTLLKNTVVKMSKQNYKCTAIYEDEDGYYTCDVVMGVEALDEGNYRLNSLLVLDSNTMFDYFVFEEISKAEYVSVYNIKNQTDEGAVYSNFKIGTEVKFRSDFEDVFHKENPGLCKSNMDKGTLYTRFNYNNDHVKQNVYVINNDIKAIYYFLEDKMFAGTYSPEDAKVLNDSLAIVYKDYLDPGEIFYFEENALYDFAESGSLDLDDFID
ncbi:MAG: hypothetical protein LBN09_08900 [Clostridioides sp.]|jgi:hypothetical protein|nr:hypothetical protein [Clostridioides sp.]